MGALRLSESRLSRGTARLAAIGVVALIAGNIPPVLAAAPGSDTLSTSHMNVDWSGGPLSGTYSPGTCAPPSCDEFTLQSAVPPSYWSRAPGGIAVRISWGDTNEELDLYVMDSSGNVVTSSQLGGVDSQQVFISDPPPGTYTVEVEAFYAVNRSYKGIASVVPQGAVQAEQASSGLRFSPPAVVDPQFTTGEPGVFVEPDGTAFVDAPWHQETETSFVWRSRPDQGGLTFDLLDSRVAPGVSDPRRRSCTLSGGGGDTDLAEDRTGTLYLADLEAASVAVSVSADRGNTWTCSPLSASQPQDDRPWLAAAPQADGAGPNVDAYLVYRPDFVSGVLPGTETTGKPFIQVDITRDGGHTWSAQGSTAEGLIMQTGPAFTSPDGTLYEIFSGVDGGVWLAASNDQGRTFRTKPVSSRPGSPSNSFVTAAADSAGNLYAAWVDAGSFDVLYSYSLDRGNTWSAPLRVSPPDSTAVMPWLAAAGPGDVAIGWYGSPGRFQPNNAGSTQEWFPMLARTLRGDSRGARFQVDRMVADPTHFGVICLSGVQCPAANRTLADFFKIAIGPDGGVVAAFDDNGRSPSASDGGQPAPYVEVVRQTGGLGMTRPALALNLDKSNGDARFPPTDPGGAYVPSLGFTSMPAVRGQLPQSTIRFSLGDARNLANALTATSTGAATDAYWLVIWKAADLVEYAGMHVDRTGTPDFFGGDSPVPVGLPSAVESATGEAAFSYASYPSAFKLNGAVDPRSGSVTVDLASGDYHLVRGEKLRSLQAFSMTGALTSVQPLPMQVIDSTAPIDVTWTGPSAPVSSSPLPRAPLAAHSQGSLGSDIAAGLGERRGASQVASDWPGLGQSPSSTSASPNDRPPPRTSAASASPIPDVAFAVLLGLLLAMLAVCARLGIIEWKPRRHFSRYS